MTARDTIRLLNATATGERKTMEPAAVDMARYDRLPAPLRRLFQESAVKAATSAFEAHLSWAMHTYGNPGRTMGKFADLERNEIAVFAGEYRAECGTPYPHVAAGVTVQRYGEFGASKHPPRRYGPPVVTARPKRRRWRKSA